MTFTVINTNDSGAGSLRQAITNANTTAGADTIAFNIPGSGVQTISPTSALPNVTEIVLIDGYTQPGATQNASAQGTAAVLKVQINGANAGSGTDGLTLVDSGITVRGLAIYGFKALVGVAGTGIRVTGDSAVITGNFIGVDATGAVHANEASGIEVSGTNVVIGGATPAERNVISGNGGAGVRQIAGDAITVAYDIIGRNPLNSANAGNGGSGVRLEGSTNAIIGGKNQGNVIAANAVDGVTVTGATAAGNFIIANSMFGNTQLPINLIGAPLADSNDADDADSGPNGLQNYPVLQSVSASAGSTTVQFTLDTPPSELGSSYRIDVYASAACAGTGNGQGEFHIGGTNITTTAGETYSINIPATAPNGLASFTATASDPRNNSSEFSVCRGDLMYKDSFE